MTRCRLISCLEFTARARQPLLPVARVMYSSSELFSRDDSVSSEFYPLLALWPALSPLLHSAFTGKRTGLYLL